MSNAGPHHPGARRGERLGAGAILKLAEEQQIKGLTSAAGLWLTAAVGVAAGLGRWGSAMVGVALIWFILDVVARVEARLQKGGGAVKSDHAER